MTQHQSGPLNFQLNESVWLDHHSRSADITALSLEPVIEIEEDHGFVSIKGYLELSGRFDTDEEGEDTPLDLESSSLAEQMQYEPFRVEQKEVYQKELKGKIEQRFPVDITIPASKVQDLEQVFVNIDQFDYSIVDQHRLNIEANVTILGVATEAHRDVILSRQGNELRAEPLDQEFSFPNESENLSGEEVQSQEPDRQIEPTKVQQPDDQAQKSEVELYNEQTFDYLGNLTRSTPSEDSVIKWDEVHETSEEEMMVRDKPILEAEYEYSELDHDNEVEKEVDSEVDREVDSGVDTTQVLPFDSEIRTHLHASPSEELRDLDEAYDESMETRSQDATSTFLSQLLSYKETPENDVTRLKMCIIQKDESLEEIAQRYDLRVTEIMRFNKLETQEISSGQILYIPRT
ncbi:LysM peptidoglycan-binding domain-containing protein [Bacillus horti]|uniref:Stage VI sporulation protein D n=1 Tax=Caldalkalibacillus horti TaxID=77523 RepID=A0ABT9VTK1_9BACI|nr:LysM peptidoglycan-binding domain-containing protein [Bacillus horti]MDQ0164302.1 stage VI sporulation protein D [Bacillus horti]